MSLKENGVTVVGSAGAFVPADLIAKLSGVSLGTVRTIIAAIDTVGATHAIAAHMLVNVDKAPLSLPDEVRSQFTRDAFEHVKANAHRINPGAVPYLRLGNVEPRLYAD